MKKKFYQVIKRILDILFSIIGIVLFIPFFLIIGIIIKIDSKGSIFYVHERVGKNDKKIKVIKFRTMYSNSDEIFNKMPEYKKKQYYTNYKICDDERVTKFGKFLRKYYIDEIPQLFNVLKGDMSIIGPRPIIYEETLKYGNNRKKFLSVKPGITGYWQVNAYSEMKYDERIKNELFYVEKFSFKLDFIIFFRTIKKIFIHNN